MPRLGHAACSTICQACVKRFTVRPHDSASYATLMPCGMASIASLRRSSASAAGSSVAWRLVELQASSTLQPSAAAISIMLVAMSTL